ncbi:MAG: MFS transporter [Acidaminococcaceae bacterium]|nr:MFS transporter [Acidaminococcaceae bacterium]
MLNRIFSNKALDSRITSANTQKSEMWLGYFAGPCFVYMVYYAVAGTYLTQFYTDVLGLSGLFLTLMPLFSKIFDAFTNIVMGRIIDRTRTRQGKARPWVAISGVLMAVTGILLYTIPQASYAVQIVWIVVSYNLFFALAFTIYNMSHALMVPLSTRNTKQRDGLAMLTSAGMNMIPGLLVTIILPLLIRALGVGDGAQSAWIKMMSIISILAIPGTLIEYYFTKERVTEENMNSVAAVDVVIDMKAQLKACFSNKYWKIVMVFGLIYNILNILQTNIMPYYANWVLADNVAAGTNLQVLINAIGQAPLGFGIFLLWPLVRKFGKRRVMMVGFVIAALGCLGILVNSRPDRFNVVLIMLLIRSLGAIPTYAMAAQLAEALDHIEWANQFRADGFSASINAIIVTVTAGLGQSIILGGISALGYIYPEGGVEQVIQQPDSIKTFFIVCFVGVPLLGYLLGALLQKFFDVEERMPEIQADIIARHRAAVEAAGGVYVSPEEKAALELAEQEKISEQKRIEELKAKCQKKGLNFTEEEAKYQAKLAAQKAKAEARANKGKKK